MSQKKIIFLHGFFASGQCIPAQTISQSLSPLAKVLTPDLPLSPGKALEQIRTLCRQSNPDLLIGNSCGAFYAQIVAKELGIAALLGNPFFVMTEFLSPRIGAHQYKSMRLDGNQSFIIDQKLIDEFAEIQSTQFQNIPPEQQDRVWGLFGDNDPIAHFEPMFLQHYSKSFHFPGAHTPTASEVDNYYVPLAKQLLSQDECTKKH